MHPVLRTSSVTIIIALGETVNKSTDHTFDDVDYDNYFDESSISKSIICVLLLLLHMLLLHVFLLTSVLLLLLPLRQVLGSQLCLFQLLIFLVLSNSSIIVIVVHVG